MFFALNPSEHSPIFPFKYLPEPSCLLAIISALFYLLFMCIHIKLHCCVLPSLICASQLLEFNKPFKHLEHACKAICELTALHKGLVSSSIVWTFCPCWGLRLRLTAPECPMGTYISCTWPPVNRIYANLLKNTLTSQHYYDLLQASCFAKAKCNRILLKELHIRHLSKLF